MCTIINAPKSNNMTQSKFKLILDDTLSILKSAQKHSISKILSRTYPSGMNTELLEKLLPNYNWTSDLKQSVISHLSKDEMIIINDRGSIMINEHGINHITNGGYSARSLKQNTWPDLNKAIRRIEKRYDRKQLIFGLILFILQLCAIYILLPVLLKMI